jgi:mannose-6-phosphate isomerase-like protein (cupin superfamily)
MDNPANFFEVSQLEELRQKMGKRYLEFLRIPAMSAGLYTLPAGAADTQSPHHEDELYYVVRGRARVKIGEQDEGVKEGSVLFVGSAVEHRFYDITEELVVLVFFSPAESM